MKTPKRQFSTRVCMSPLDTSAPSATALVVKLPTRTARTVPSPEALGMDRNRLRLPSVQAGLKPSADGIRSALPFGLPKRQGQHERTSRRAGGVASSQVDPPQGGPGARAQRQGRGRDRSPFRLPEWLDGPAPLAFVRPPAAPREVRLNGFPGALAEWHRHRSDGGGRRVPGAAPTGVADATKVGEPAYPRYNRGAGEGRCPFDPRQTRAPVDGAGGGVAPLPPVAARLGG